MTSLNKKKIAKNTAVLYVRQILILLINLYIVRVVLDALGVVDFGVYSTVAGIVALCSFLSTSMASATQRFFSFAIGQNNQTRLNETFSVNIIIYFIIAIVSVILLETIGLYFVKGYLNVPSDRYEAMLVLYHFSVLTLVAVIFSSPFIAIIISHEEMNLYAYISIIDILAKLGVVLILNVFSGDKLIFYGVSLSIVSVLTTFLYIAVCYKKYQECQLRRFYWNRELFREIVNFTSWTLFGQLTTVVRNQAVTILLNQAFSPVVVASRAIAVNVASQVAVFSNNFNIGLYPSIIKTYATNDKKNMFSLIFVGSKLTFFLMWIFALPFLIKIEEVLSLWLTILPENAVLFTRLALIEALIMSISLPIATAARAPGKMKLYELTLGTMQIMIFIISWLVISMGAEAYYVFIVAIIMNMIMFVVRLLIVSYLVKLPVRMYVAQVVTPLFYVVSASSAVSYVLYLQLPKSIYFTFLMMFISLVTSFIFMYYFGLDKEWRGKIRNIVHDKIKWMVR